MSTSSSNQDQTSNKSSKRKKNKSKKSKTKIPASEVEAGTSSADPDPVQNENESESRAGFFPPNMWFWKPAEPQQEVQIKNWSMTSQFSITNNTSETQSQPAPVRQTESQYMWPNTINIREPQQRLVNQPTLDQLIEQKKIRDTQLIFAEDFNKHVDYLGERISSTKLTILIAQLNNMLPTTSQEEIDFTKKLTRSKPLQLKKSSSRKMSKASERSNPEEIAHREQLRQNQLEEYDYLRGQVGLFGEKYSTTTINSEAIMDGTISKTDLNKLVDVLNEMPDVSKNNMNIFEKLIKTKPQIVKILREVHRKSTKRLNPEELAQQQQLRQNQLKEFDDLRDQIAVCEESVSPNIITANITAEKGNRSILVETISKTELKELVNLLNEPTRLPMQESSIRRRPSVHLSPEEIEKQKQLRQNQIQEYDTLREQIGLFGERTSETNVSLQDGNEIYLEKTISRRELNSFINQLNGIPNPLKKKFQ